MGRGCSCKCIMQLKYLVKDWKTEVDPFVLCNNLLLINFIFSQEKEHVFCVIKRLLQITVA